MNAVKIIDSFTEALHHAEVTPRDISPVLGIHLSSLYRIMAGRTSTTKHTLRSLQMVTVFLRGIKKDDMLNSSPLALFLQWVGEEREEGTFAQSE